MSGLVLQTQDDAPPGLLGDWAERRQIELQTLRVDHVETLPDPRDPAFAVVLGSSASVVDPREPWIARVVEWLRRADAAALPVLGICFGAQALAAALGARVFRLPRPEIGWIEVETADAERIPAGPWLAWHEDGFELPPLAYELARNACGTQAFCHRGHLAVQFHPEATAEIAAGWDRDGRHDLSSGPTEAAAAVADRLFDGFAARAGLLLDARTA
jgi:GMP synthase-like glutamine amidotransferase